MDYKHTKIWFDLDQVVNQNVKMLWPQIKIISQ